MWFFANYDIHLILKYRDSQPNECKNLVFLWSFNPSLFFGFVPHVLLGRTDSQMEILSLEQPLQLSL